MLIAVIIGLIYSCQEIKKPIISKKVNDTITNYKFTTPIKLDSISVQYRIKNEIFNWPEFTAFIDGFDGLRKHASNCARASATSSSRRTT